MPARRPATQVYVPSAQRPHRYAAFVVRGAGADPTQLAPSIRSELAQLDKTQPVYDVRSMQRVLVEDLGGMYLFTGMLGVFATIAMLLAAAGVYGLVSFSVSQRTREIGLRMALGARPAAILGMVVARGSGPMAIGLALGSAGAAALVTVTASALAEVDLRDPLAYIDRRCTADCRGARRDVHSRTARHARRSAAGAEGGIRSVTDI